MMDIQKPIIPMGGGIWLQLVMNLVPFLGVVYYDWSVFALLYSFWLETLAMSFFDAIRIMFAQRSVKRAPHIGKAIGFFLRRAGILLFYMIFMVVFVGFIVSEKQSGESFIVYLVFVKDSFRLTILTFFIIKSIELIYTYFLKGEYKNASPDDFTGLFSRHLIVIHLVIVLGVFAHQFFAEKVSEHSGVVAFAGVFIIIKSLADLFSYRLNKVEETD